MLITRQVRLLSISSNRFCSTNKSKSKKDVLDVQAKLYDTHVATTGLQKTILGIGSSISALSDPYRADMVAVSGEVTGKNALDYMLHRMKASREGRKILKERPSINTKTVDLDYLRDLPDHTLGHTYVEFLDKYRITPDSRDPVRYVDDEDLAYVMKRYRESHDLVHTILNMPTDMVGEVVVKWVEGIQYGLPMCIGGAVMGPARFSRNSQFVRFRHLRPWAISVGQNAKFLLNIYYEERWEQDIDDLRDEYKIEPLP